MELQGRSFSFVVGSDVHRDGMYYEASEPVSGKPVVVAEVFYSDESRQMTFTTFVPDLPVELVAHMIEQAQARLVPVERQTGAAE